MSQRLPVVRMFNLGIFACMDSMVYNWGNNTLIIKAVLHNGKYCEVDLGFNPRSRLEVLLQDRKEALKFINSLAEVFSRATGQSFDSVRYLSRKERWWFFTYSTCKVVCRGG